MKKLMLFVLCFFFSAMTFNSVYAVGKSVYTQKPNDPEAFYFTPEAYGIKADGKTDVSEAIQKAVNQVKTEKNFGILFIPEGKYLISKTIYVPGSVRMIGYGENRPEFILGKNTPGFQDEETSMFWFTGGIVTDTNRISDANAGTFYSGWSNINVRIESGNPKAIALRTHWAQHGLLAHTDLFIGDGYAGVFDVGNEMEDVNFYGGQFGISTNRPSPSWPMMMVDVYFEGQKQAAITARDAGLTIVNMHIKDTPYGVILEEGNVDRFYMEDCLIENVTKAAVSIGSGYNSNNQINMVNVDCSKVPTFVHFAVDGKDIAGKGKAYKVKDFTFGLVMDDLADKSSYRTLCDMVELDKAPTTLLASLPELPSMTTWVNVRDFGAKGDDSTDDTKAFKEAIEKYDNIYVPQGWYIITETLKLKPNTKLIGLHPMGTQIKLADNTPAFGGFGSPVAMVESSEGGDNILNGIGINTNVYNNRAVGVKWMASGKSYMNDVKFVGGHGTMNKPDPNATRGGGMGMMPMGGGFSFQAPTRETGKELAWDSQYWSLWVTNGGGGTFKDIWTANSYATAGFYVSNTSTPSRVYAMSLEHHIRYESRYTNVENWKFYANQYEEESVEGKDCLSTEMINCKNLTFINDWFYRVVRVNTPRSYATKMSGNENIQYRNMHNRTQILYLTERVGYDMNKNLSLYPNEFAKITITGKEPSRKAYNNAVGVINKLAFNFEFATGAVADSKGNVYFCENRLKKIYKWSAETNEVSLYADYPWKPFSLAVDTQDNLLVVCRYDPQRGFLVNGKQETVERLPDDYADYSNWGNSGWAAYMYAISPNKQDDMQVLPLVPTNSVNNVKRVIYPTHRLRDNFDETVVATPEKSFLAPDGVTIIPQCYDLCRSIELFAVTPGQSQPAYVVEEFNRVTATMDVDAKGRLSNIRNKNILRGEYGTTVDNDGNLYIAEGQIFVFNKNGEEINRIDVDERPLSIVIGGKNKDMLFITTSTSLYSVRVK